MNGILDSATLHHLGCCCLNIANTLPVIQDVWGEQDGTTIFDPEQNVNVCVVNGNGVMLELLEPADETSPVYKIAQGKPFSVYHFCYEVPGMEQTIKQCRAKGFMQISKITYSNVFNAHVCFLYHSKLGIIELLQAI